MLVSEVKVKGAHLEGEGPGARLRAPTLPLAAVVVVVVSGGGGGGGGGGRVTGRPTPASSISVGRKSIRSN